MTVDGTVARFAAVAVAVGAVAGSTSALLKVAATAELSPAWSLPLALDGAALVAAMAVRRRQGDVLAWGALVAATATSAAVQWLSAPAGLVNHLAHVVPPVAVLVAFELYQRVTGPEPVVAGDAAAATPAIGHVLPDIPQAAYGQPVAGSTAALVEQLVEAGVAKDACDALDLLTSPPPAAPEPVVAAADLVGAVTPGESRADFEQTVDRALTESTPSQPEEKEEVVGVPANTGPLPAPAPHDAPRRKREPRPTVRRGGRQVEADPAVVDKVRAAVHELEVPLDQVTRDQILKHLRPGAPHASKVGAALNHLRSQP